MQVYLSLVDLYYYNYINIFCFWFLDVDLQFEWLQETFPRKALCSNEKLPRAQSKNGRAGDSSWYGRTAKASSKDGRAERVQYRALYLEKYPFQFSICSKTSYQVHCNKFWDNISFLRLYVVLHHLGPTPNFDIHNNCSFQIIILALSISSST